jgi:hypothetical protein
METGKLYQLLNASLSSPEEGNFGLGEGVGKTEKAPFDDSSS